MKEKIKNIVKNKYFRIIIKFFIWFLLLLILSFILVAIYSFTFEKDKIAIDRYNFEQLEKAKPILESIPETDERFYSLKEFNQKYNANIKSIKNCYDISNDNWSEKYIFWFKLESYIYIYIYRTKLFAYPKYDMPYKNFCVWECIDLNKRTFENIISKPCKDY